MTSTKKGLRIVEHMLGVNKVAEEVEVFERRARRAWIADTTPERIRQLRYRDHAGTLEIEEPEPDAMSLVGRAVVRVTSAVRKALLG